MNNQLKLEQLLSQWQLKENTKTILLEFPDVVESLLADKLLPSFNEDYSPQIIEILLDDVCYIKIIKGKLSSLKDCPLDFNFNWLEYRFDGECALFICHGEEIVNRLELMANLEEELNFNNLLNSNINI
jgi:hypothetical protein